MRLPFFSVHAAPWERFAATFLCALFGISAWIVERQGAPTALVALLVIVAYGAGGGHSLLSAIASLRRGRLEINFLMVIAALGSAALGHWNEGAILFFLFSLSDALEHYAVSRTQASIRSLIELRPTRAARIVDGLENLVPIERLSVGDVIRVRPGERFPIDGTILEGSGMVDESLVTGESRPVTKHAGSEVASGSFNTDGAFLVRMTKSDSESTLSRIIQLVEKAQTEKVSFHRWIEDVESPYILAVLGLTILASLSRWLMTGEWVESLRAGMVLLVAASPCAVVLATPVATLAAITRGARLGLLFKGGTVVERLSTVSQIAFDKTGTLTRGRPTLRGIIPLAGSTDEEILALAAALEVGSQHPFAAAIAEAARARSLSLPPVTQFSIEPGLGIAGKINGVQGVAGRLELLDLYEIPRPIDIEKQLSALGEKSFILIAAADGKAGLALFEDEVRPEAPSALESLRRLKISSLVMLSGDQPAVAESVGRALRLDLVRSGLKPDEKVTHIRRLAQSQSTAMVGDGINDAPALAIADVGIAMGRRGTDVALETADLVLMHDDLRDIATAIELSRATMATIKQGLGFAFAVIALLVFTSMVWKLSLPIAVIGHEGSTIVVILSGMRLFLFGQKKRTQK